MMEHAFVFVRATHTHTVRPPFAPNGRHSIPLGVICFWFVFSCESRNASFFFLWKMLSALSTASYNVQCGKRKQVVVHEKEKKCNELNTIIMNSHKPCMLRQRHDNANTKQQLYSGHSILALYSHMLHRSMREKNKRRYR